jgi:hypothetical protein
VTPYLDRNGWLPYRTWFAHPFHPIMVTECNGGWLAIDDTGRTATGDTERAAYLAIRGL